MSWKWTSALSVVLWAGGGSTKLNIPISLLSLPQCLGQSWGPALDTYWLLVYTGEQNWTVKDPVSIVRNAKENLKREMKDKGVETFRGSHGKHFWCVLTLWRYGWLHRRDSEGVWNAVSRICPWCRLRFSVLNCRDCQQQDSCVSNSADELQEDALTMLECVKSYLCASCAPHSPSCGLWNHPLVKHILFKVKRNALFLKNVFRDQVSQISVALMLL